MSEQLSSEGEVDINELLYTWVTVPPSTEEDLFNEYQRYRRNGGAAIEPFEQQYGVKPESNVE